MARTMQKGEWINDQMGKHGCLPDKEMVVNISRMGERKRERISSLADYKPTMTQRDEGTSGGPTKI